MWPSSRPLSIGYGHTAAPAPDMVGLMASGFGVGVSVLPLLTGLAPSSVGIEEANLMISRGGGGGGDGGGGGGGIQFNGNNLDGFGFLGGGSSLNSGTGTCHDCGNQAKKDCSHRRCRSCCKSRGFDCSTHVKSTWVPAARRRERQMLGAASDAAAGGTSSGSTSGGKKARLIASQTTTNSHTSTSNTPTPSFDASSAADMSSKKAKKLPEQIRAPAVFKCVRVTAVEGSGSGGGNEYAYQAVVKIGGHIFKGYLYDHGVEARDGFPTLSNLHLGDGGSTSSPIIDPADVYGSSAARGGGMAGGSGYGNPIN